jgi:hypothetical protein|tara:strand:- start:1207 stop:1374 length:168 start_codon:yes stop_codon:yes gene_type:complete
MKVNIKGLHRISWMNYWSGVYAVSPFIVQEDMIKQGLKWYEMNESQIIKFIENNY